MITLLSYCYGRSSSSEYKTFDEAAIAAVFQVEFNTAYPAEIREGDNVLMLREIATKAGYLLDD